MQEVWTETGIYVLNRVFVRGIPSKMTELQLEILFGGMGYDVQNVRIVEDLRTGANKGYGFVTFRTAEEARKVQEMRLVDWNGKMLQIDMAVKRKTLARAVHQQQAMQQRYTAPVIYLDSHVSDYNHVLPLSLLFRHRGTFLERNIIS
ncbi:protein boule-like isoform X1 [Acropora millepora]|uniref:protein boule-like isoform X1 n=1 Tax=Acropora millepora TaxID=45264 RepID=UPI001CF1F8F7|nr:protein boule-like isoform X1 [Acropora millepora]